MRVGLFILPLLSWLLLSWGGVTGWTVTFAETFEVGHMVKLQATKPIGVPLHRKAAPSYFKHVPSGTVVTIERLSTPWIQIRFFSGDIHWVHAKYVKPVHDSAPSGPISTPPLSSSGFDEASLNSHGEKTVWANLEGCERMVAQGHRMAPESSSRLRITTWNLRWFPEGTAPDQLEDAGEPTDLEWLTCTIRWMQLDIIALQEILGTPEATQALQTLTEALTTQTGHTWHWHRQPCGRPHDQHVGLLWNDRQVSLSHFDSLWEFNSKARNGSNPCTYGLRPGQYAWVQSRTANGVDFHLIALHLKSGATVFDVEARHTALNRIDQAVAPLLAQDRDVIIVGDFNTMGAGDRHSPQQEIKHLRRHISKETPGFRDVAPEPQCTHYFRGRGGWLDHVLAPRDMKEITVTSTVTTGYCAVTGCQRIRGDYPLAYRRLSDHCPVIVEIVNRDRD